MPISPAFIDEIKSRNQIADVIGGYVALKRAGSNMVACCPFHNEKTPSFTVFLRSDSFYCFGCGAGGDVISFVMKAESLDYVSAVEFLAKRAGLQMPEDDSRTRGELEKRRRTLQANVDAAKFFSACLTGGRYPRATEYIQSRNLSRAVRRFGIGYCPPERHALSEHMLRLGYKKQELKDAFLCGISSDGKDRVFDYFSDRIIFPIIDAQGNVIAFGGRAMGDVKPKYLNSNDTPAFKKSRNLFALNFAKKSDDDFFILCEGYVDVIALHMAGFSSAVASLGTSLTQEQAGLLKKYKTKAVICYDGDEAGQKATKRAIPILSGTGLEIKVLKLPDDLDPDDYLKKHTPEDFRRILNGSSGSVEYQYEEIASKHDLSDTEDRLKAAAEVCGLLAKIYSDVEREVYTAKFADRLSVPAESLRTDVKRKRSSLIRADDKETRDKQTRLAAGYGDTVNPDMARATKAGKAEEVIIGMLQLYPEYIKQAREDKILSSEDFCTGFGKKVYESVEKYIDERGKFDLSYCGEEFTPEEKSRITKMSADRLRLTDNGYSVFKTNCQVLRKLRESSNEGLSGNEPTTEDIMKLIKSKKP